ncbi:hypothetical protein [Kitasatospora azatica]|uniref:hypothetical protein n=1 Tax=Kitasatospora azatica TaxID=58347 RepID=UPI00056BA215|nr:hypothetical protein [Kitasatospora azatica]
MRLRVLAPLALLLTACGAPTAQPPAAACQSPAEAVLPHTAGTLAETDSGSFCLAPGQQLSVFLTATGSAHWSAVSSSDPQVLAPAKAPLTAPIGVTPALFGATAAGTARLTSQDGTGHDWAVTVVVR